MAYEKKGREMLGLDLIREIKIENGKVYLMFYIYNADKTATISPFSYDFFFDNDTFSKNFKFVSYDDFKKIIEKYFEKFNNMGFREDEIYKNETFNKFDYICLEPDEKLIEEYTQKYINLLKNFLNELKEINEKKKIKIKKEKEKIKIKI